MCSLCISPNPGWEGGADTWHSAAGVVFVSTTPFTVTLEHDQGRGGQLMRAGIQCWKLPPGVGQAWQLGDGLFPSLSQSFTQRVPDALVFSDL